MKPTHQIALAFVSLIGFSLNIMAQSSPNKPATGSISDLTYQGTRPDVVVYQDGDYDAPPAGQVMMADWRNLQQVNTEIGTLLATAPNDESGKQSTWYPQLQAWKAVFDQFVTSKAQTDLFALIPVMAGYVGRDDRSRPLSQQLETIEGHMRGMGSYVIRAMASHATEQQGTVAQSVLSNFVRIFAVPGFVAEGDWEDEEIPINAAGVLILDAPAVVTQLTAGLWQQGRQFIGDATTAGGFFSRYAGTGDGLAVLKTKYAANQSTIDAKFVELKNWVTQQEAAASGS